MPLQLKNEIMATATPREARTSAVTVRERDIFIVPTAPTREKSN